VAATTFNCADGGGSQGDSQGGSSSARSFDLTRPGVAPPLTQPFGWSLSSTLESSTTSPRCSSLAASVPEDTVQGGSHYLRLCPRYWSVILQRRLGPSNRLLWSSSAPISHTRRYVRPITDKHPARLTEFAHCGSSRLERTPHSTYCIHQLSLYHNFDSSTRLRYDDTTTHSTTTEVIEITICVRFNCDLRYNYETTTTKN